MKVKELLEELKKANPETDVKVEYRFWNWTEGEAGGFEDQGEMALTKVTSVPGWVILT